MERSWMREVGMVEMMMVEMAEEVAEIGKGIEGEESGGEETMVVTKGFGWREQFDELWWIEGGEV